MEGQMHIGPGNARQLFLPPSRAEGPPATDLLGKCHAIRLSFGGKMSAWRGAVVVVVLSSWGSGTWAQTPPDRSHAKPENTKEACSDHLDNDMDGHVDCDDQDCQDLVMRAPPTSAVATNTPTTLPPAIAERRKATTKLVARRRQRCRSAFCSPALPLGRTILSPACKARCSTATSRAACSSISSASG